MASRIPRLEAYLRRRLPRYARRPSAARAPSTLFGALVVAQPRHPRFVDFSPGFDAAPSFPSGLRPDTPLGIVLAALLSGRTGETFWPSPLMPSSRISLRTNVASFSLRGANARSFAGFAFVPLGVGT